MNTFYILSSLVTAVTSFVLGLFVYSKSPKSDTNRAWFLMSVSVAIWSAGFCAMISGAFDKTLSLFLDRVSHIGAIFAAIFYLYFVLTLLKKVKEHKKILTAGYFSVFLILLFIFSKWFIVGLEPKLSFKYYPIPGILYSFFSFMFFGFVAFAQYLIVKNLSLLSGNVRNQVKYVLFASTLGYLGGATTFPLVYNFHLPPIGGPLVFVYTLVISIAIIKHRLMNIEVIIKKTAIFAGLFAFVSMSFVGTTFLAQELFADIMGANSKWAALGLTIALITLGMRPLENWLIRLTDKVLFQKKYDYQQTLREASEGMTLVTDMKKLLNLIARIVSKSIRVKSAAIFQLDDEKNKYVIRIRRGNIRRHGGYSLGKDNALVWWLSTHKEAILLEEVEDWVRSERFLRKQKGLKDRLLEIKEEMTGMDSAICVPSYGKGHLIGFLVLGEKLSGDIYTQQDIHLLSTLASEAAIAVENAKNFMEVEKLREKERESYIQTVLALAQTVDEKDSYTRGHLEDVNYYGMRVAEELEQSSEFKAVINKEDLDTSLHLHDIGKIGVPDAILHKNGKLTASEWEIMKQHCEIGARIVEPIAKLKNIGNIIKHHQEKYDGSGYPDGLRGEEIPLEARIISVVDAYHAMISDRPYRKALPEEVALGELRKNVGTQFDPIVVAAFVRAWEKGNIKKI